MFFNFVTGIPRDDSVIALDEEQEEKNLKKRKKKNAKKDHKQVMKAIHRRGKAYASMDKSKKKQTDL